MEVVQVYVFKCVVQHAKRIVERIVKTIAVKIVATGVLKIVAVIALYNVL